MADRHPSRGFQSGKRDCRSASVSRGTSAAISAALRVQSAELDLERLTARAIEVQRDLLQQEIDKKDNRS